MLIGLTGTYGSGKSTVAAMLAELGVGIVDTDAIAREVVEVGSPALEEILEVFGEGYARSDGSLDRRKMAATIFASRERRAALNAILHPPILEEMSQRADALVAAGQARGKPYGVVLIIPLLFEEGLEKRVEKVAVVAIGEAKRFGRVRARDGIDERAIVRRLAAQWPQRDKVARADWVIDNSGSLTATRLQVHELHGAWIG